MPLVLTEQWSFITQVIVTQQLQRQTKYDNLTGVGWGADQLLD